MPEAKAAKKTSIGGQALIEGIMMRGPEKTSMAVRHVSGEIVLESWPTGGKDRPKILRVPIIRGVVNFVDSLRYGYKCLMRSAELSGLEDEEPPQKGKASAPVPAAAIPAGAAEEKAAPPPAEGGPSRKAADGAAGGDVPGADGESAAFPVEPDGPEKEDEAIPAAVQVAEKPRQAPAAKAEPEKKGEKLVMTFLMVLSGLLGVALAIFLFLWLPSFLYSLIKGAAAARPAGDGLRAFLLSDVTRGVFEGVFRILLFVGYMLLVSLMKDIKRVFMYHGAEHKTIFCYEAGEALTVENVRKQRRFHPRCGTSFMILMLLIGVIVSMFIRVDNPLLRTGIKLLTIPLVVGIGYELIKLAGRKTNWFTRVISAPGMWLQHITTKEPDDGMIECAIRALEVVIPEDPDADNW